MTSNTMSSGKPSQETEEIIDNLFRVKDVIYMNHSECKVMFSTLITRTDSETLTEKVTHFNKHFFIDVSQRSMTLLTIRILTVAV